MTKLSAHKVAFLIILSVCVISYLQFPNLHTSPVSALFKELRLVTGLISYIFLTFMLFFVIKSSFISKLFGQLESFRAHKIFSMYLVILVIAHMYYNKVVSAYLAKIYAFKNIDMKSLESFVYNSDVLYTPLKTSAIYLGQTIVYIALALIIIALIQKIKYRHFIFIHRLFAYLYIILTLHILFTIPLIRFNSYIGYIALITFALGLYASLKIIFKKQNSAIFKEVQITSYTKEQDALEIGLLFKDNIEENKGYIYYIKDKKSNYHPLSLAYVDDSNSYFIIKKENDFTKYLYDNIDTIKTLDVQGPFVEYDFTCAKKSNVLYIANGSGICSFLNNLIKKESKNTSLLFIIRNKDSGMYKLFYRFKDQIERHCKIYLYESSKDGRISDHKLQDFIKNHDEVIFSGSYKLKRRIIKICAKEKIKVQASYNEFRNLF